MDLDLLGFLGVTTVVMAVPGPSVLFAITQRVQRGRVAGAVAVLGLETGLLIHVLAACLGVSAVIAASPGLLTTLRLSGAAYLAFLGLRQLGIGLPLSSRALLGAEVPYESSTAVDDPRSRADSGRSLWGIYRSGMLVDLLNPKTLVFFLALLPQFIPDGGMTTSVAATMVSCVVVLGLLFDGSYAALAGRVQRTALARIKHWGPSFAGWCFLALAAALVVS